MFFLKVLRGLFRIEALYNKILYTLFVLFVFRLGKHIPIPGVDLDALHVLRESFATGGFFGYANLMTGGMLSSCSIFSLGITPYITSSIMMQFLTLSIPYLEALQKEGGMGRILIKQYTRYLALAISLFQGAGLIVALERGLFGGINVILNPGWVFRIKTLLLFSVGAIFVMWLGEQISRFGVGNGSSILIFAGIVATIPQTIIQLLMSVFEGDLSNIVFLLLLIGICLLSVCIIFLEKGERRVVVYYAKKMSGRSGQIMSNTSSYIPFKINSAGVMPVILTGPMLNILTSGFDYLVRNYAPGSFMDGFFAVNSWGYNFLTILLILWFNFAFMSVVFNPFDLADNLRKSGGFLPGLRPGSQTAEFFEYLFTRIGIPGALYMAFLAIVPGMLAYTFSLPYVFSGLSLLIAVGVALDIASQVEAYFIDDRYESFFTTQASM